MRPEGKLGMHRPESGRCCVRSERSLERRGLWGHPLLCEHAGSCVLGGGEGSGLLEEKVCFHVCVAEAEECDGGVYFGYFF